MGDFEKYWVSRDGENIGPFTLDEVRDEIESGSLSMTDLACELGDGEWVSLHEILDPSADQLQADKEFEPRQKILKRSSGGSLNLVLTVMLGLLLLACLIVFLLPKNGEKDQKVASNFEEAGGFGALGVTGLDFAVIEGNATALSDLTVLDGLVHGPDGIPFTGWSVSKYENSPQLSNLTRHEKGNWLDGFSWRPNGVRCNETTLSKGDGILVSFHENGQKENESTYKGGLLQGTRLSWFGEGQKKEEAQYKDGILHGRLVSFHLSGQKTKEIFYLNGLQDGRYELLTKDGQKYDEGSYRAGKRDGKRFLWSSDGTRMDDETYEDGELVSSDASTGNLTEAVEVADSESSMLFDTSNVGPDVKAVADLLTTSLRKVRERFLAKNEPESESFNTLSQAAYQYRSSKGTKLENDAIVGFREAFVGFRNTWQLSFGLNDGDGFSLSVPPASVTFGSVTLSREELFNEGMGLSGSYSLDDLDFILGETQSMFQAIELKLLLVDEFQGQEARLAIWDELWKKGDKAESANLLLKGSTLVFSVMENYKKKSLDRNGNSVFTDEEREVELSFSASANGKEMGYYTNVLRSVQDQSEDTPSPQNAKLIIRQFEGIVIRSGEMLYPDVTVMLAGVAPLEEDTLIRGVKVDLGEPLPKPVLK